MDMNFIPITWTCREIRDGKDYSEYLFVADKMIDEVPSERWDDSIKRVTDFWNAQVNGQIKG